MMVRASFFVDMKGFSNTSSFHRRDWCTWAVNGPNHESKLPAMCSEP